MAHLSPARYKTYWDAAGQNHSRAMELYEWNLRAAAATVPMLSLVEVAVRNTLDRSLREWARQPGIVGNATWTDDTPQLVLDLMRGGDDLEEARSRAAKAVGKKRDVGHDDVVAHLSFGDLRYLLPTTPPAPSSPVPDSRTQLWNAAFGPNAPRPAFPHYKFPARFLGQDVAELHALRNRVFHQEPLLSVNLGGRLETAERVLAAIDPDLRDWLDSLCSLRAVEAERSAIAPSRRRRY